MRSSFFDQWIPDKLLKHSDWRANDDYVQIVQKIKNSKRNEAIDQMMDFLWKTYTFDLNNRCKASISEIDNQEEYTKEIERFNVAICGEEDDDVKTNHTTAFMMQCRS